MRAVEQSFISFENFFIHTNHRVMERKNQFDFAIEWDRWIKNSSIRAAQTDNFKRLFVRNAPVEGNETAKLYQESNYWLLNEPFRFFLTSRSLFVCSPRAHVYLTHEIRNAGRPWTSNQSQFIIIIFFRVAIVNSEQTFHALSQVNSPSLHSCPFSSIC